jgi:hypothetical protein
VLDAIAMLDGSDRDLAEGCHAIVTDVGLELGVTT